MDITLKDDLTMGSLENIKVKPAKKITLRWKCEKKQRHQRTFNKGDSFVAIECNTKKPVGAYKFNGTKFVPPIKF